MHPMGRKKKTLSRFFRFPMESMRPMGVKKKHYPVFFRFPMDSMGFSEHISSQTSLDSIQCIQWVEKKDSPVFFRFPMESMRPMGVKKNPIPFFFAFQWI